MAISFKCDFCGTDSKIKESAYNRYNNHFCSEECKNQYRRDNFAIRPYLHSIIEFHNIQEHGIYKMYHVGDTASFYIGSTQSNSSLKGFYVRWNMHIRLLLKGKHHNRFIQRLIDVHGIEGIRFQIIEICRTDECRQKEYDLIRRLQPNLNIFKNGHGWKGVNQFDRAGKFIASYDSMQHACIATGVDRGSINNVILGNRLTAGGFMWTPQQARDAGWSLSRLAKV